MINLVHSENKSNAVTSNIIEVIDLQAKINGFWDAFWHVEQDIMNNDTPALRNVRDHLLDQIYKNREETIELLDNLLEKSEASGG